MTIKLRPTILLISAGLIAALIISLLRGATEATTALITALAAGLSKLVESEEKTTNGGT